MTNRYLISYNIIVVQFIRLLNFSALKHLDTMWFSVLSMHKIKDSYLNNCIFRWLGRFSSQIKNSTVIMSVSG